MRRLARRLLTLCLVAMAGAVAVVGAFMVYLILDDTVRALLPGYGMPPDSFRQVRWLLRDTGTLTRLVLCGTACGLLAPFATRAAQRHIKRKRFESGFCPICGYDLRGLSFRCPECGIAPSKLGRGG